MENFKTLVLSLQPPARGNQRGRTTTRVSRLSHTTYLLHAGDVRYSNSLTLVPVPVFTIHRDLGVPVRCLSSGSPVPVLLVLNCVRLLGVREV